jgi:hypothetical protein
MMSQRTPWSGPQNLKNNTGFGVIRIQVAVKSTCAPLAGSDRYHGIGATSIMIDSLHPLFEGDDVPKSTGIRFKNVIFETFYG